MIKRISLLAILVGVGLQLSAAPAYAQVTGFVGTWTNADPNTQGIRTLTISTDGKSVSVTGPGMRTPVPATVYGAAVDADPFSTAKTLVVQRTPNSILIIHLTKSGQLEIETLASFTDGRQPYGKVDTLIIVREPRVQTTTRAPHLP